MRWLVVLSIAIVGCSKSAAKHEDGSTMPARDSNPDAPSPTVTFSTPSGDVVVKVEIVATPAKIMKGLMWREHLAPDGGMLFLMGEERVHEFYMRNTLIPLDMIFITRDFSVAGVVEKAVPRDESNRSVGKPSLYVLEVNGGWAAAHQVGEGTKVRFDRVKPP